MVNIELLDHMAEQIQFKQHNFVIMGEESLVVDILSAMSELRYRNDGMSEALHEMLVKKDDNNEIAQFDFISLYRIISTHATLSP